MKIGASKDLAGKIAIWSLAVDAAAEAARSRYVTNGAGQQQEYALTMAEAQQAIKETSPDPDFYPMLSAELAAQHAVGNAKATLLSVAGHVLETVVDNHMALASIKQTRRIAKMQIAASDRGEDMEKIYLGIKWS